MLANFCKFKQMKSKAHIKQHFADNGLVTLGIFFYLYYHLFLI